MNLGHYANKLYKFYVSLKSYFHESTKNLVYFSIFSNKLLSNRFKTQLVNTYFFPIIKHLHINVKKNYNNHQVYGKLLIKLGQLKNY